MLLKDGKVLHFTLGPVQGFVAQARRTRDLWSGSFLLSWLAGHAIKAVLDAGGDVDFPAIKDDANQYSDPLLKAIMMSGPVEVKTSIGSLPNRFKATVPPDFDPNQCSQAVLQAWQKVADTVYEHFVAPVENYGEDTQAIWQRQVSQFWDISWVLGEACSDGSDNTWLDSRKNWRSHRVPLEGGDHCTIMGDWQELSGHIRSRGQSARERQDQFWHQLRSRKEVRLLDLRPNERLCSIALIKRLFPLLDKATIGWQLETGSWPSTSYMAAIPWIKAAWTVAPDQANEYAALLKKSCEQGVYGERGTQIKCLAEVPASFRGLDGRTLYPSVLKNEDLPLKDEWSKDRLLENLENLHQTVENETGKTISPYYALLIMDGDSLGTLLRSFDNPAQVSRSLARFTSEVPEIVENHNGVTVYAGGDDVLALLPLPDAIRASERLRQSYRAAFDHHSQATISGAIVFAHQKLPLMGVLKEAHHQLDNVAKQGNGRNSLAISVLKGGARHCQWVSAWERADNSQPPLELEPLAAEFAEKTEFSNKMIYALRDRFGMLLDSQGQLIPGLDPVPLLAAEFIKNAHEDCSAADADRWARGLVNLCTSAAHTPETTGVRLQPEGALLVRFLADGGTSE